MRAVAILHVPDSPYGAVRLGYGDLARAIEARGGTLEILSPEHFPRLRAIHPKWWVVFLPLAAAAWLWRRRRDYDVALFHSYAGWIFNLLPSSLPTVTNFHGLEPLFYSVMEAESRARGRQLSLPIRLAYGWMLPRLLRGSCRRSSLVSCLNQTEERYLLEHGWTTAERLMLVRQAVPPEFFIERLAYVGRARRILVLSQWLDTKGVRYLADAFAALGREHPDLELWCYGTRLPAATVLDSFPPDLRPRITVVDHIPQSDLPQVFGAADIFVHVSLSEGSSNAVAQAMAAALPMVLTPVGVVPDLLQDGRDCLMVPTADARATQMAIDRLIDDVALRTQLGQSARRMAAGTIPRERDGTIVDRLEALVKRSS